MKTILVVEDNYNVFKMISAFLDEVVEVLYASDLDSASAIFNGNHSIIDLIIMDACVPGSQPNSMPLVKEIINAGFTGPILASSSDPNFSSVLVEAGATHQVKKNEAGEFALKLLGL